ncbi:heparin sulfate O-sulfotransferase-like [Artemia franciscana]|uniref:Heparin sulfate O-sulfotransferase n=1 Tax=Artemia franciscana TaxID=6661 RepID=A0AA88L6W6_ARTSF|nr:hypothetical protein QYM36_009172 [Artemia franciscana]KAK2714881.1 hypothetical protein QYM36_009172 [Artemia franciscana]
MRFYRKYKMLLLITFSMLVFAVYVTVNIKAVKRFLKYSLKVPRGLQIFPPAPKASSSQSIFIYNRIPKTGSTSFMGLVYDLCEKNNFYVLHLNLSKNSHTFTAADQVRFTKNITEWTERRSAFYHGHVAYLDFRRIGSNTSPVYLNLVRKPLDRLISYFYFLRYGDDFRPHLVRKKQGDKMTFDECVNQSLQDCDPVNLWLQIPFFCGHAAQCWEPESDWALEEAKRNLAEKYFLVGITEEIESFIEILEFSYPNIFKDALNIFRTSNKTHLRRTNKKVLPSSKTLQKIQESKIWQMENEFYEFAASNFYRVRKKMKESLVDGKPEPKFFYEKVRPK